MSKCMFCFSLIKRARDGAMIYFCTFLHSLETRRKEWLIIACCCCCGTFFSERNEKIAAVDDAVLKHLTKEGGQTGTGK